VARREGRESPVDAYFYALFNGMATDATWRRPLRSASAYLEA
jgi:hypothetical protein